MFPRLCKIPLFQSFFLFGARGTGKSTLLQDIFALPDGARTASMGPNSIYFDLLDTDEEQSFQIRPQLLAERLDKLPSHIEWVVIDEIQKVPKLLDIVHQQVERTKLKFALTGSSARKLKAGGANLLAGRASVFQLGPLSFLEIGNEFVLDDALAFGTLPKVTNLSSPDERATVLRAYAQTYLKEEVWAEQLVRKISPFRKFIEVVAQMNGKIMNYASLSRDTDVDVKTVQNYFEVLEDTLLGFHLESYESSFRSRLSKKPKFYLFDTGVTRALSRTLTVPLLPQTSAYGNAFEHFVILEAHRIHNFKERDFRFSYLMTKGGLEVDLVVERPGLPLLFIEIKSSNNVTEAMISNLEKISKDFPTAYFVCLSQDRMPKRLGNVDILPWQQGLRDLFAEG